MKKIHIILVLLFTFVGYTFSFNNIENISLSQKQIQTIKEKENKITKLLGLTYTLCIGNKQECINNNKTSGLITQISIKERHLSNLTKSKYDFVIQFINDCGTKVKNDLRRKRYYQSFVKYEDCVYTNISKAFITIENDYKKYTGKNIKVSLQNYNKIDKKISEIESGKIKAVLLFLLRTILIIVGIILIIYFIYKVYERIQIEVDTAKLGSKVNELIIYLDGVSNGKNDENQLIIKLLKDLDNIKIKLDGVNKKETLKTIENQIENVRNEINKLKEYENNKQKAYKELKELGEIL